MLTAALHVGLLKSTRPSAQEILSLPYFDSQKGTDHGLLQYVGTDSKGVRIYSAGLEAGGSYIINSVRTLLTLSREAEINFVDTLPGVNWWMKAGGFISRFLGFKGVGRPLVIYGSVKALPLLAKLVSSTEEEGE